MRASLLRTRGLVLLKIHQEIKSNVSLRMKKKGHKLTLLTLKQAKTRVIVKSSKPRVLKPLS